MFRNTINFCSYLPLHSFFHKSEQQMQNIEGKSITIGEMVFIWDG